MVAGSIFFKKNSYDVCCAYVTMTPHYKNFDFKLTSEAKIQPVIQKCKQGRQILFSLLTIVTRWSRFTSNCYAMIGQNLTGEFMRKIYAASCNLFTDQLKLTEFCVNL